jgi:excisionase family DNA binding protein
MEHEALVTIREASEYLGLKESTLRRWRSRGQHLTFIELGQRAVRVRLCDCDKLIEAGMVPPKPEKGEW